MDAPVGWSCERGALGRYGGVGRLAAAREVTVGVTSVGDAGVHRGLSPTAATRDDAGHFAAPGVPAQSPEASGATRTTSCPRSPRGRCMSAWRIRPRGDLRVEPPTRARADTVGENLAALGFVSLSLRCHLFLSPTWLLVSWTFSPLRTSRADSLRTLSLSLSSPRFGVS